MISLIGNPRRGYALTREYDAFNESDAISACIEARERINMHGEVCRGGGDIPTTAFERLAMQHGMLKNKSSLSGPL